MHITPVPCLSDNYAYLVHASGRSKDLEPLLRGWLPTYDLLVKVPVVTAPTFDGTRDTSVAFQLGIDRTIDELLKRFRLDCLRLPAGDRVRWLPAVLAELDLPTRPSQLDLFGGSNSEPD